VPFNRNNEVARSRFLSGFIDAAKILVISAISLSARRMSGVISSSHYRDDSNILNPADSKHVRMDVVVFSELSERTTCLYRAWFTRSLWIQHTFVGPWKIVFSDQLLIFQRNSWLRTQLFFPLCAYRQTENSLNRSEQLILIKWWEKKMFDTQCLTIINYFTWKSCNNLKIIKDSIIYSKCSSFAQ